MIVSTTATAMTIAGTIATITATTIADKGSAR
jgi:hypothetical protein